MSDAIIIGGQPLELFPDVPFVDAGEIQRPGNWLANATAGERAAVGVKTIVEPPATPAGKVHVVTGLAVQGGKVVRAYRVEDAPAPPVPPVPSSVTNYQARAVMRQVPMPDGRSLFTTVDSALRAAVDATKDLPEFDPQRVEADVSWQAWEQANTYERNGTLVGMLAGRFGLDAARTDDLFRQAATVTA